MNKADAITIKIDKETREIGFSIVAYGEELSYSIVFMRHRPDSIIQQNLLCDDLGNIYCSEALSHETSDIIFKKSLIQELLEDRKIQINIKVRETPRFENKKIEIEWGFLN